MNRNIAFAVSIASALAIAPLTAATVPYHYVDWTSANVAGGTATGTITLPDTSTVTVDFAAINPDGSPGNLNFAQTNGTGTNYWNANGQAPFLSGQVDNAAPDSDIISLVGGVNQN